MVSSVTNGHIYGLKVDYKGTPLLQSDITITHGNGGSPAFDPDSKVVGVATYGNVKEVAANFFVPINTALEFVRPAGPNRNPVSSIERGRTRSMPTRKATGQRRAAS